MNKVKRATSRVLKPLCKKNLSTVKVPIHNTINSINECNGKVCQTLNNSTSLVHSYHSLSLNV